MINIKIEKLDRTPGILPGDEVKLKQCGNISEIVWCEKIKHEAVIIKVDKDHYRLASDDTGTIYEFEHNESRKDDMQSVRESLSRLRDLINTNVQDVTHCRWCTFTYAENMTDFKRIRVDWQSFNRKARKKWGKYEYIIAVEPQGRGAWHIHAILIFSEKAPYMDNAEVAQAWGQGFVKVKRLDDVDNVGAYLTAYLGDMEVDEAKELGVDCNGLPVKECEVTQDNGKTAKKRYIKGARLSMYPPGINLYRSSRGISYPVISYTTNAAAEKKVSGATLTFERTIGLSDEETGFNSVINYRYYNSTRCE